MTNQDRKATRPGADRVTAKGPEMILADATVLTMDEERRAFTSGYVWMKNGRIHRVGPTTELKDVPADIPRRSPAGHIRSEARRVGKECGSTMRSRWSAYH